MADQEAQAHQPGRRFATYRPRRGHQDTPEKSLVEGLKKSGGRNNNGRKTSRHRGGGAKRKLPPDRLQALQGRRSGEGRRDRVRPEPHLLHRAAALPRRREALHPRARSSSKVGDVVSPARAPRSQPATPCRWRTSRPVPRSTASSCGRPRWPARPLRRHVDPARGEGGRLRDAAPALRRDAHGARRVPRRDRVDRQRRAPEHHDRQGRPLASQGQAPADARHRDEPGRPPARWWRGHHDRRPVTRSRRGASRRSATARARRTRSPDSLHRARPPAWQEGVVADVSLVKKGPVGRGAPDRPDRGDERGRRQADGQDLVACLDDLPGDGRSHDRRPRRPQAHSGVRLRVDGRPQARRVRADAHVPRPRAQVQDARGERCKGWPTSPRSELAGERREGRRRAAAAARRPVASLRRQPEGDAAADRPPLRRVAAPSRRARPRPGSSALRALPAQGAPGDGPHPRQARRRRPRDARATPRAPPPSTSRSCSSRQSPTRRTTSSSTPTTCASCARRPTRARRSSASGRAPRGARRRSTSAPAT